MSLRRSIVFRAVLLAVIFCDASGIGAAGEPWKLFSTGSTASLRGISAVSDQCCWVSGSKGTVLKSIDGGTTWTSIGPHNCEAADFRDIHAWDESNALIMSAGDVDRLYRTNDGGKSWSLVFEEPNSAAFFDGIAFNANGADAWLMGDPLENSVYLLRTTDHGKTWHRHPTKLSPHVSAGIAAFAASGTHLLMRRSGDLLIGLGGADPQSVPTDSPEASLLRTVDDGKSWQQISVPIAAGPSSGIFSISELKSKEDRVVAVGGDYQQLDQTDNNIAISDDGGVTWRRPNGTHPSGFRSIVLSVPTNDHPNRFITAGPTGTDMTLDGGDTWQRVSGEGFHTMSVTLDGVLWASGASGRIARWRDQDVEQ